MTEKTIMRKTSCLLLGIALGLGSAAISGRAHAQDEKPTEKKGPPFADKKKESDPAAPKPQTRIWNVLQDTGGKKFGYSVSFKPGIPDPGQVTEVIITANALPARPDPVFGSQVPLEGARIVVELMSPAGELVGRYLAHPMPLSKGRFGVHLTPAQEGIYTLSLRGKTAKGEELTADIKLPVKVWPLPKELEGSGDSVGGASRRAPIKG